jgi:hypothetical protein
MPINIPKVGYDLDLELSENIKVESNIDNYIAKKI